MSRCLVPTEQTFTMAVQRETIPHLILGPLNHAIMFFIFGIAQGIKEPLEPIHPADILRRRIPRPRPKAEDPQRARCGRYAAA